MNLRAATVLLGAAICATAQEKSLVFDVASVKVRQAEPPPVGGAMHTCPSPATCLAEMKAKAATPAYGGPGSADPGRVTFRNVPMWSLLLTAFAIQRDQLSAPDSIQARLDDARTRYEIVATVPPGATKEDAPEMLKNLLVERFGLVYHMQKRDFDGYRLTVAKGGPKLTPAAPADGPQRKLPKGTRQPLDDEGFPIFQPGYPNIGGAGKDGVVHFAARMVTTEDLLIILGGRLTGNLRLLEDKTGLTGKYDFKIEFADPRHRASDVDEASEPAPDLFTVLEKQLGLKLEKIRVPSDVVVIDKLNQLPTEN